MADRPADALNFTGQVALITGGGRGIGRAIAERLLAHGAHVVICGRSDPPDDLPAGGGRVASFIKADVREPDDAERLVREAAALHGRLDVLVNNAGGSPYKLAADASPRFTERIIGLNLVSAIVVATHANAVMQQQAQGGVIVNIGSVSGLRPSPGTAAYGAAKAGLVSATQSLAVEWAPKVRINTLSAGAILTDGGADHYGGDAGVRRIDATIPMGRMGRPDDLTGAVLFLASPLSGFMTGENLIIHGGGEEPAFLAAAEGVPIWER